MIKTTIIHLENIRCSNIIVFWKLQTARDVTTIGLEVGGHCSVWGVVEMTVYQKVP